MTDVAFEALREYDRFLELVRLGTPELNAALEVGWTPKKLRELMQDVEFRDLVSCACAEADGSIEQVLYREAKKGKQWAVMMWLFNRQPDRWRDLKRIEVKTEAHVSVGVVKSVRTAVLGLLDSEGIEAMQALPPVIDAESEEL